MSTHISQAMQSIDEAGDFVIGGLERDALIFESVAHSLIAIAEELQAKNAPVALRNVTLRGSKLKFGAILDEMDKEPENG